MNPEQRCHAWEIERKTGATITNVGECRGCGEEIYWGVTKAGKRCPYDQDGTAHFATCPEAKKFRKGKS